MISKIYSAALRGVETVEVEVEVASREADGANAGREEELSQARDLMIVGELALDGTLRPVKGALSIALGAKAAGRRRLLLPEQNAREAAMVSGLEVYGLRSLHEAWQFVTGKEATQPPEPRPTLVQSNNREHAADFFDRTLK